ncbi:MAG: hypothetical protein AUH89_04125 [Ktedonobacter sp. 13_1_40CM_4_52_4]|nr:MAG: hypothetical protein AUH89_04125 [Ktedonobacter sp. 13_1_40CM_4_52_4]
MTHILLNPIVIIIAVLVLAVVILVTAVFLFRSSGKKKGAKADKAALSDWQRQGQQGTAGTWNQPGVGGQADNWAQQQPGAWAAQPPAQQQPGAWAAQPPAQQQPGAWAAQPQQPAANPWGAQPPARPQQPPANAWGAQPPAQQPGAWAAQPPAQQQPAEWGSAASNPPSAGAGIGGSQPSWGAADATFMPQKSTPAAQDPWGQSQSAPPQQGGDVWGMQSSSPSQQQAPPSYSAGGSGQSWAQSGKPASPAPTNEPWGQPAPSQQPAWGQQPSGQQVSSPPATSYNANASPPWQQGPGQGPAFGGPPPAGFGAPAMQPDAASLFANNDNDKTMLRPSGSQGTLGTVRIEEGKEPGRVYEVRKEELSIGRSRESDIFLEDLAVSRLHAKILSLGNGNYALKDEGSANGTKVNGQVVNKYQTYPLQEGDRIQLGQTVLVFAKR